jgi:hypothetical protein
MEHTSQGIARDHVLAVAFPGVFNQIRTPYRHVSIPVRGR